MRQAADADVAQGDVAVVLAEAEQVEAEVDGGIFGNAGEVYAVGAGAITVVDAGHAGGGVFGAVALEVEKGVGAGEAVVAEDGEAGVGVEQGDFEGIVGCAGQVIEGCAGQGEAQIAVLFVKHEHLAEAGLAGGDFAEGGRACTEPRRSTILEAHTALSQPAIQCRPGFARHGGRSPPYNTVEADEGRIRGHGVLGRRGVWQYALDVHSTVTAVAQTSEESET